MMLNPEEVAVAARKAARMLGESGAAGHVEPGKVFTYDGGEDAEFSSVGSIRHVVLSKDVFDLTKVKKIKCVLVQNGLELEFAKSELTLVNRGEGFTSLNATYGNHTLPAVSASEFGGLLGYAQEGFGYISYIEFEETIHPIDPKFIPGAVLPVIELSEETINAAAAANAVFVDVTEEEAAFFRAAKEAQTPCIAKVSMGGISVAAVSNLAYAPMFESMFYKFDVGAGSFSVTVGEKVQIIYNQNG